MLHHLVVELHNRWSKEKQNVFGITSSLLEENTERVGGDCANLFKSLYPEVRCDLFTITSSDAFAEFKAFLSSLQENDSISIVVIEGVLEAPETLSVMMNCDAVVLNVRAQQTEREQVQKAVELLRRNEILILGSVLNYGDDNIPPSVIPVALKS